MKGNDKTERRMYKRFSIKLSAQYLQENSEKWKSCAVMDISRGGMGIIVYMQERIPIGSFLQLEIIFLEKEEPIKASGILRWIKQQKKEMNFLGGVELIKIDSGDKWILLDCAYDEWSKKKKE
jgi:c-di-GMP-binding flagellar brake protein YcgR